jgi:superfamily II DNA or RNA helicase
MGPKESVDAIRVGDRVTARGRSGEFLLIGAADIAPGKMGWIFAPGSPSIDHSAMVPLDHLSVAPSHDRSSEDFLARLVTADIQNPWTVNPGAAFSARAMFKPFQFRPLLKFHGPAAQRLLISDEAGLGKTIEAGYIIAEGIARGDFRRTLVLCPSHLRPKWRWELRSRFGLWFQIVNAKTLLQRLSQPGRPFQLIVSMDGGRDLDLKSLRLQVQSGSLDLLVVDEIHKLIGRGGDTLRRDFGQALSITSGSTLGLSATPVQLDIQDLRRVFDIVTPGLFDEVTFKWDLEATRIAINVERELRRFPLEIDIPRLNELSGELEILSPRLISDERERATKLIGRIRSFAESSDEHTVTELARECTELTQLSRHMTRARAVDVGEHRVRHIRTISVPLKSDERIVVQDGVSIAVSEVGLYEQVDALLKRSFSPVHRLQLSSSLPAMLGLLKSGLAGFRTWEASTDQEREDPEVLTSTARPITDSELREIDALLGLYRARPRDSKWTQLSNVLQGLASTGEIRKAIVFTHWIPTFAYLAEQLNVLRSIPWVGVASDLSEEETSAAISRFRNSQGFTVLLATDRLSEGIDLEEADCVINYDLPYNPQVVEQRIGRIDRVGQKSSKLTILNLIVEGSLDQKIYSIILTRAGVFTRFVGEMRPITAEMVARIDTGERETLNSVLGDLKELRTRTELMEHPAFAGIEAALPSDIQKMHRSDSNSLRGLDWALISHMFRSLDPKCEVRWNPTKKELLVGPTSLGTIDALVMMTNHEDKQAIELTLNRAREGDGRFRFVYSDENEDLPRNHPLYKVAIRLAPPAQEEVGEIPWILQVEGKPPLGLDSVDALVTGEIRFQGKCLRRREAKWWKRESGSWSEWTPNADLSRLVLQLSESGVVKIETTAWGPLYASLQPTIMEALAPWVTSMSQLDRIQRRNAILNELFSLARREDLMKEESASGGSSPEAEALQGRWNEQRDSLLSELERLSQPDLSREESVGGVVALLAGFTFPSNK